jgi:hypothetical protein
MGTAGVTVLPTPLPEHADIPPWEGECNFPSTTGP